jgi:hypothetical protein
MALFRCTFSGSYAGGEAFTTGFYVNTTADGDAADLAEAVGDIYVAQSWSIATPLMPSDTVDKMTVYKYASIGTPAIDAAEYELNEVGTASGSNALPPQNSIVVTLRTGAPGASRRGRMYLPFRGMSGCTATGLVATGAQEAIGDGIAAFFGAVNLATVQHVVVASQKTGQTHNVTTIEVGNVFDTQRRRRAALTESRYTQSISQV